MEKEVNSVKNEEKSLHLNKETIDVLVANVIPTTKYFEVRFNAFEEKIKNLDDKLDKQISRVDEKIDKLDEKLETQISRLDVKIDKLDEKFTNQINRLDEKLDMQNNNINAKFEKLYDKIDSSSESQRGFTLKMFSIAVSLSFIGVLSVFLKIFGIY